MSAVRNATASICPACGTANDALWRLDHAAFRHLDFAPLAPPPGATVWENRLCACAGCGVLYRLLDAAQRAALSVLYRSGDYAEHREDHRVRGADGELRTAATAQAEALLDAWPGLADRAAILDIGCFDGKLLAALAERTSAGRLVGYDVAPRAGFPPGPRFRFHHGARGELSGPFDLVALSQSLIYIDDLAELFAELRTRLAADGRIFVHVPDTSLRPASLLLADQVFHFTPASLASLFARHGYTVEFLRDHPFRRDILLLAHRQAADAGFGPASGDAAGLFARLDDLAIRLRAVPGDDLAVFGTTIEAAFACAVLGERARRCVDENPDKQGRAFNGRPVVPPAELAVGAPCVVPMGSEAAPLVERLSVQYPGRFLLL